MGINLLVKKKLKTNLKKILLKKQILKNNKKYRILCIYNKYLPFFKFYALLFKAFEITNKDDLYKVNEKNIYKYLRFNINTNKIEYFGPFNKENFSFNKKTFYFKNIYLSLNFFKILKKFLGKIGQKDYILFNEIFENNKIRNLYKYFLRINKKKYDKIISHYNLNNKFIIKYFQMRRQLFKFHSETSVNKNVKVYNKFADNRFYGLPKLQYIFYEDSYKGIMKYVRGKYVTEKGVTKFIEGKFSKSTEVKQKGVIELIKSKKILKRTKIIIDKKEKDKKEFEKKIKKLKKKEKKFLKFKKKYSFLINFYLLKFYEICKKKNLNFTFLEKKQLLNKIIVYIKEKFVKKKLKKKKKNNLNQSYKKNLKLIFKKIYTQQNLLVRLKKFCMIIPEAINVKTKFKGKWVYKIKKTKPVIHTYLYFINFYKKLKKNYNEVKKNYLRVFNIYKKILFNKYVIVNSFFNFKFKYKILNIKFLIKNFNIFNKRINIYFSKFYSLIIKKRKSSIYVFNLFLKLIYKQINKLICLFDNINFKINKNKLYKTKEYKISSILEFLRRYTGKLTKINGTPLFYIYKNVMRQIKRKLITKNILIDKYLVRMKLKPLKKKKYSFEKNFKNESANANKFTLNEFRSRQRDHKPRYIRTLDEQFDEESKIEKIIFDEYDFIKEKEKNLKYILELKKKFYKTLKKRLESKILLKKNFFNFYKVYLKNKKKNYKLKRSLLDLKNGNSQLHSLFYLQKKKEKKNNFVFFASYLLRIEQLKKQRFEENEIKRKAEIQFLKDKHKKDMKDENDFIAFVTYLKQNQNKPFFFKNLLKKIDYIKKKLTIRKKKKFYKKIEKKIRKIEKFKKLINIKKKLKIKKFKIKKNNKIKKLKKKILKYKNKVKKIKKNFYKIKNEIQKEIKNQLKKKLKKKIIKLIYKLKKLEIQKLEKKELIILLKELKEKLIKLKKDKNLKFFKEFEKKIKKLKKKRKKKILKYKNKVKKIKKKIINKLIKLKRIKKIVKKKELKKKRKLLKMKVLELKLKKDKKNQKLKEFKFDKIKHKFLTFSEEEEKKIPFEITEEEEDKKRNAEQLELKRKQMQKEKNVDRLTRYDEIGAMNLQKKDYNKERRRQKRRAKYLYFSIFRKNNDIKNQSKYSLFFDMEERLLNILIQLTPKKRLLTMTQNQKMYRFDDTDIDVVYENKLIEEKPRMTKEEYENEKFLRDVNRVRMSFEDNKSKEQADQEYLDIVKEIDTNKKVEKLKKKLLKKNFENFIRNPMDYRKIRKYFDRNDLVYKNRLKNRRKINLNILKAEKEVFYFEQQIFKDVNIYSESKNSLLNLINKEFLPLNINYEEKFENLYKKFLRIYLIKLNRFNINFKFFKKSLKDKNRIFYKKFLYKIEKNFYKKKNKLKKKIKKIIKYIKKFNNLKINKKKDLKNLKNNKLKKKIKKNLIIIYNIQKKLKKLIYKKVKFFKKLKKKRNFLKKTLKKKLKIKVKKKKEIIKKFIIKFIFKSFYIKYKKKFKKILKYKNKGILLKKIPILKNKKNFLKLYKIQDKDIIFKLNKKFKNKKKLCIKNKHFLKNLIKSYSKNKSINIFLKNLSYIYSSRFYKKKKKKKFNKNIIIKKSKIKSKIMKLIFIKTNNFFLFRKALKFYTNIEDLYLKDLFVKSLHLYTGYKKINLNIKPLFLSANKNLEDKYIKLYQYNNLINEYKINYFNKFNFIKKQFNTFLIYLFKMWNKFLYKTLNLLTFYEKKLFKKFLKKVYFFYNLPYKNLKIQYKYYTYLLFSMFKYIYKKKNTHFKRAFKFFSLLLYRLFYNHFLPYTGLKIIVKGRFGKNRKQIALLVLGYLKLQSISKFITYSNNLMVTRRGSYGFHIWCSFKDNIFTSPISNFHIDQ